MKLAAFCAMKNEWGEIKKKGHFIATSGSPIPSFVSEEHPGLTLYQTGVGFKKANEFFRYFENKPKPDIVVQFGLAGALKPHLKTGDIILTTRCLHSENEKVDLEKSILQKAENILKKMDLHFERGPLFTSSIILENQEKKLQAGDKTGALAVDMETFFLARFCREKQLPFLSARVIFDPLDWDLGDLSNLGFASVFNPRFLFNIPRYQRAAALGNKRLARFLLTALHEWC